MSGHACCRDVVTRDVIEVVMFQWCGAKITYTDIYTGFSVLVTGRHKDVFAERGAGVLKDTTVVRLTSWFA